jgi:hypothetical protein
MKNRFFSTLLLTCLPWIGYGQFTHLGPLAAYSSQVKEPGVGIQGIYRVNDAIKITPNALYYLPHKINTSLGTQKFTWWAVNLDGNYVIVNQGLFEGFGIMGLNFTHLTGEQDEEELGQIFKDKRSVLKLGLNVGAGVRLNLGERIVPFGEVRYTIGSKVDFTFNELSTSQFGIFAGILIRINEDKDRTETEEY